MRSRAVTAEQIVDAADRVARRLGLEGLTIRNLCVELGVTAPAIYRHYPAKEIILTEVIDRVIARAKLPGPEAGDWAERLKIHFISVHDAVRPYGGLAVRMGQQQHAGPAAYRNQDYLDGLMADAGIGRVGSDAIMLAVFVYVWGHLLAAEAVITSPTRRYSKTSARRHFLWGLDHLLGSFRNEFSEPTAQRAKSAGNR